jgi:hypothetical protein
MNVDVATHTVIDAPVAVVAGFASEPDNAPRWSVRIRILQARGAIHVDGHAPSEHESQCVNP